MTEVSSEDIVIKIGSIKEASFVNSQIPEFDEPYVLKDFITRLEGKNHLILIAYVGDNLVGFKIGYEVNKKTFYTWMGGVIPKYRRKGIAKLLSKKQEEFVRKKGYETITLKTRNKHKNMICFAILSGFYLVGVEKNNAWEESRIFLEKKL
ncbi:GNAT family N-acetyltransferase [Candidatus Woesearchaeota archaeon]|jgi:predicted GNAT superfamily acetyltransferase|nr:GNAT family N-acetyltransferase [Candidatus Woesearchaeota archaeon]